MNKLFQALLMGGAAFLVVYLVLSMGRALNTSADATQAITETIRQNNNAQPSTATPRTVPSQP